MNSYLVRVTNCLDCQDHVVLPIYTPDSWDHEEGCYCTLVKDKDKPKLVAGDDWHLRKYTDIPDWCPKLFEMTTNEDETIIIEAKEYIRR